MPAETKVFFFWGTLQSGTDDPSKLKIPELLWTYAGDQQWEVKIVGGVGLPEDDCAHPGDRMCSW